MCRIAEPKRFQMVPIQYYGSGTVPNCANSVLRIWHRSKVQSARADPHTHVNTQTASIFLLLLSSSSFSSPPPPEISSPPSRSNLSHPIQWSCLFGAFLINLGTRYAAQIRGITITCTSAFPCLSLFFLLLPNSPLVISTSYFSACFLYCLLFCPLLSCP